MLVPPALGQLELMAVLTVARVSSFIITTVKLFPSVVHLWIDSQIVLYWLLKKLNQVVLSTLDRSG